MCTLDGTWVTMKTVGGASLLCVAVVDGAAEDCSPYEQETTIAGASHGDSSQPFLRSWFRSTYKEVNRRIEEPKIQNTAFF